MPEKDGSLLFTFGGSNTNNIHGMKAPLNLQGPSVITIQVQQAFGFTNANQVLGVYDSSSGQILTINHQFRGATLAWMDGGGVELYLGQDGLPSSHLTPTTVTYPTNDLIWEQIVIAPPIWTFNESSDGLRWNTVYSGITTTLMTADHFLIGGTDSNGGAPYSFFIKCLTVN